MCSPVHQHINMHRQLVSGLRLPLFINIQTNLLTALQRNINSRTFTNAVICKYTQRVYTFLYAATLHKKESAHSYIRRVAEPRQKGF